MTENSPSQNLRSGENAPSLNTSSNASRSKDIGERIKILEENPSKESVDELVSIARSLPPKAANDSKPLDRIVYAALGRLSSKTEHAEKARTELAIEYLTARPCSKGLQSSLVHLLERDEKLRQTISSRLGVLASRLDDSSLKADAQTLTQAYKGASKLRELGFKAANTLRLKIEEQVLQSEDPPLPLLKAVAAGVNRRLPDNLRADFLSFAFRTSDEDIRKHLGLYRQIATALKTNMGRRDIDDLICDGTSISRSVKNRKICNGMRGLLLERSAHPLVFERLLEDGEITQLPVSGKFREELIERAGRWKDQYSARKLFELIVRGQLPDTHEKDLKVAHHSLKSLFEKETYAKEVISIATDKNLPEMARKSAIAAIVQSPDTLDYVLQKIARSEGAHLVALLPEIAKYASANSTFTAGTSSALVSAAKDSNYAVLSSILIRTLRHIDEDASFQLATELLSSSSTAADTKIFVRVLVRNLGSKGRATVLEISKANTDVAEALKVDVEFLTADTFYETKEQRAKSEIELKELNPEYQPLEDKEKIRILARMASGDFTESGLTEATINSRSEDASIALYSLASHFGAEGRAALRALQIELEHGATNLQKAACEAATSAIEVEAPHETDTSKKEELTNGLAVLKEYRRAVHTASLITDEKWKELDEKRENLRTALATPNSDLKLFEGTFSPSSYENTLLVSKLQEQLNNNTINPDLLLTLYREDPDNAKSLLEQGAQARKSSAQQSLMHAVRNPESELHNFACSVMLAENNFGDFFSLAGAELLELTDSLNTDRQSLIQNTFLQNPSIAGENKLVLAKRYAESSEELCKALSSELVTELLPTYLPELSDKTGLTLLQEAIRRNLEVDLTSDTYRTLAESDPELLINLIRSGKVDELDLTMLTVGSHANIGLATAAYATIEDPDLRAQVEKSLRTARVKKGDDSHEAKVLESLNLAQGFRAKLFDRFRF